MKINQDFTIQKVGGSYLAVPVGETSKTYHGMIRLNEMAACIWKKLEARDMTEAELVEEILAEYDVTREVAERDVHALLQTLAENHCLV